MTCHERLARTPEQQYITTTEAATRLGVSRARVNQLILRGQLPATKIGRDNLLDPADVAAYQRLPPSGPRKPDDQVRPNTLYQRDYRARRKTRG